MSRATCADVPGRARPLPSEGESRQSFNYSISLFFSHVSLGSSPFWVTSRKLEYIDAGPAFEWCKSPARTVETVQNPWRLCNAISRSRGKVQSDQQEPAALKTSPCPASSELGFLAHQGTPGVVAWWWWWGIDSAFALLWKSCFMLLQCKHLWTHWIAHTCVDESINTANPKTRWRKHDS